jgi:hypothetical protein
MLHMLEPQRRCSPGNTLLEYTAIACLILILTLGAWQALGLNLKAHMGLLKNSMRSQLNDAKVQVQLQQLKKSAFQKAATAANAKMMTSGNVITAAGLVSIADMQSAIQTVGANGATDILASSLKGYITKLQQDKNLTSEQINLLSQLAEEGHTLANGEKALHDAVTAGQSTVIYNGHSYAVSDFQQQFGFINNVGINASITMDADKAMPQLAPFVKTYQQAVTSGALKDPDVQNQVTYLSKQIAALSDLAKWNTTTGPQDLNSAYVTAMKQIGIQDAPASISEATDTDSTGICNSGGQPGAGCH